MKQKELGLPIATQFAESIHTPKNLDKVSLLCSISLHSVEVLSVYHSLTVQLSFIFRQLSYLGDELQVL